MGQMSSLMLTTLGVFTTLFDNHTGKDISTTLSAGAYFIFSATAGPYMACQPGFVDKLKQLWWKFLIIGTSDFYSTYLQTLAFSFTSVPSNMLITVGFYTFFVIILALFMIKTKYKLIHYASVIISIIGMVVVIWQDLVENQSTGSNPLLGDLLCVGSGFLFALTTVSEELLIKRNLGIIDFLAMLGFSGTAVSSIQLCVLDRVTLVEVDWDLKAVLYFLGYHICNCSYYIFFILLIVKSSSVAASLSVLTSNVYSLIFAIFLFNNRFSILCIGGFVIIMFGLVLYNVIPTAEGDTDQSVFSTSYWYNYGHSLFCEWRCSSCSQNVTLIPLNDAANNNNDDDAVDNNDDDAVDNNDDDAVDNNDDDAADNNDDDAADNNDDDA